MSKPRLSFLEEKHLEEKESLLPAGEKRKRKREVVAVVLTSVLFLILTYIQVNLFSISHRLPFIHGIFFFGLVNLNIVLILFLFFLVFRNIVKIFVERKGTLIGSSLRSKLIAAFTSFSFVPTILMFLVSVFYINSSFDKWFSVKMTGILKDSLEVTNSYYIMAKKKNYHFAHQIAESLNKNRSGIPQKLSFYVEQYSLDSIEYYPDLWKDRVYSINKNNQLDYVPEVSLEFLEKGITHKLEASTIHHFEDGNLVRVIVPVGNKKGALVVSSFIPMYLISKMDDIATAYDSFKDLDPLEYPIKSIYLILLVLMTLVIMLCATWFGFTLAKGLSVPLVSLSEASEQVAKGIFKPVEVLSGSTEINSLVDSFNKMMKNIETSEREVKDANQSLRETLDVLDKHNRYIEVILSNVSTGVVSVNSRGEITTLNREAEKLLKVRYEDVRLENLQDVLGANYDKLVAELLRDAKRYKAPSIKKEIQIDIEGEEARLQVTVTFLKDDDEQNDLGFVLVLDDLTVLANAQRAAAWREVAKRIAHEIKNPLTPIKLAAQRLQRKFGDDLEDPAFKECVDTIVSQTDGLKHLVNEFSNFARLPQVKLTENNLNQILREVVVLYSSGHKNITFEYTPDEEIPVFRFDSEQIKRVFVNLIDNAVAAVETMDSPSLSIRSKFDKAIDTVRIDIEDNGPGIDAKNIQKVFEPYYSTKAQGTGLGLAIVKKIIEDHHGYIRAYRLSPQGTKFVIELPLNKLRA